jgi:serine/threonine protein kinase
LSRGTKYYRAPELKTLKKNVGKRADIYSAGVLLFVFKCLGVMPHTEDKLYKQCDLQNLLKTKPEEFFKAHSILQGRDSSFFDDDFKDLFIAMTKDNPEERMKLRHIKETKWYRGPVYSLRELKKKVAQMFNQ